MAVKIVADTLGIDWDTTTLKHLQTLEGAVLRHFADEQKKAEKKGK